jgi:hypothetical protein
VEPFIKWGVIGAAALVIFFVIRADLRTSLPNPDKPGTTPGTGGLGPEIETKKLLVNATVSAGGRTRTYNAGTFVTYGGPGIRFPTFGKVNEGEVFFHNTPQMVFFFGQLDVWNRFRTPEVIDQLVRQGAI